jgi:hypothetical protein
MIRYLPMILLEHLSSFNYSVTSDFWQHDMHDITYDIMHYG